LISSPGSGRGFWPSPRLALPWWSCSLRCWRLERHADCNEQNWTGVCRIRAVSFVLKLYTNEMHRDEFSQYQLDFAGRQRAGRAIDTRPPQLDGVCRGRHRSIESACTVRADRTHSAGRFGDGATVVVLSPAEKWGWLWPVTDEIIGVPAAGRTVCQNAGVCRSECGRLDCHGP